MDFLRVLSEFDSEDASDRLTNDLEFRNGFQLSSEVFNSIHDPFRDFEISFPASMHQTSPSSGNQRSRTCASEAWNNTRRHSRLD